MPESELTPDATKKARSGNRRWILYVLLGVAAFALMLAVGVGIVVAIARNIDFDTEVRPHERAALVTMADLADLADIGELSFDPAKEKAKAMRLALFGSRTEIEYTYEDDGIYLSCIAALNSSTSNARATYTVSDTAFDIGVALGGDNRLERVSRNELLEWGDQSQFALLRKANGAVVGNLFMARKGRLTYFWVLVGLYIDDPELIEELFRPRLEAFEALQAAETTPG